MGKQAWVPIIVAIGCIWGALTLLSTVPPYPHIASATDDYPYPSATLTVDSTDTPTIEATSTVNPTDTTTIENTPTLEETLKETPVQDAAPPSDAAATETPPHVQPQQDAPAPEPTPILQCQPYQTYLLSGVTTPDTQLLLLFADRVVGGSMSDSMGRFAVPLNMGNEASGTHTIALVIRDSGAVIATMPCTVP